MPATMGIAVKGKPWKVLLPLLVVAILALVFWRSLAGRNEAPHDRLFGNGTVEATEVEVSARVAGRVVELPVDEGDAVTKGALVAALESEELAAQVEQAKGALAAAEAALAEMEAGTRKEDLRMAEARYRAAAQAREQAQARLDLLLAGARAETLARLRAQVRQAREAAELAESDLRRAEALLEEGAVAAQQVDHARTARDTARAQLRVAKEALAEAEAGARPEEIQAAEAAIRQARSQERAAKAALDLARAGARAETLDAGRARVEQARAALRAAEARMSYAEVYAPTDGVVTLRAVEPGELVVPGAPIVRIAALDRVWVRVYVPELEIGRVKLGQEAEVECDSFPGRSYRGRVVEIAQEAEYTPKNVQTKEERVKLVFGVKIDVENPDRDLKPGMPVDAAILVGEAGGP